MPRWEDLREVATSQHGYFTSHDAREVGISTALLSQSQRVGRVPGFRGLHRFVDFPDHEDDAYVRAFIWGRGAGVISHGSALMVHDLSDHIQYGPMTMTFPRTWTRRAFPIDAIRPYFADLTSTEVEWHGAFRVTAPARTVTDFIAIGGRPDLVRQALAEGRRRKLFRLRDIPNRFDVA